MFCFEDAQVDGEHGFEVASGKKDHDVGSPRCAGWQGFSPRTAPTAHVKTNRRERRDPQGAPHKWRRIVTSWTSFIFRSVPGGAGEGFRVTVMSRWSEAALTESDDENDPLIRPTCQTRNENDVNTVPASSGAVAAHLGEFNGDARQVEFDMT